MRQTEGDLRLGGLARAERRQKLVGKEDRKTDSHTRTAGQMRRDQGSRFSPGYVNLCGTHAHTHTHTGMYILSSTATVIFSNRAQTHLKCNSARLLGLRVDDYPP